jgi:hypothetical protein
MYSLAGKDLTLVEIVGLRGSYSHREIFPPQARTVCMEWKIS